MNHGTAQDQSHNVGNVVSLDNLNSDILDSKALKISSIYSTAIILRKLIIDCVLCVLWWSPVKRHGLYFVSIIIIDFVQN